MPIAPRSARATVRIAATAAAVQPHVDPLTSPVLRASRSACRRVNPSGSPVAMLPVSVQASAGVHTSPGAHVRPRPSAVAARARAATTGAGGVPRKASIGLSSTDAAPSQGARSRLSTATKPPKECHARTRGPERSGTAAKDAYRSSR